MKKVKLIVEIEVDEDLDVTTLVVGHHESLDGITIYPETQGERKNQVHSSRIIERQDGIKIASMKRGREKNGTLGC